MTSILTHMYLSLKKQMENLNRFERTFNIEFNEDNDYWEAIYFLLSAMEHQILEEFYSNNEGYKIRIENIQDIDFWNEFDIYLIETPREKFNINELEEIFTFYIEKEDNEIKDELILEGLF